MNVITCYRKGILIEKFISIIIQFSIKTPAVGRGRKRCSPWTKKDI